MARHRTPGSAIAGHLWPPRPLPPARSPCLPTGRSNWHRSPALTRLARPASTAVPPLSLPPPMHQRRALPDAVLVERPPKKQQAWIARQLWPVDRKRREADASFHWIARKRWNTPCQKRLPLPGTLKLEPSASCCRAAAPAPDAVEEEPMARTRPPPPARTPHSQTAR